MKKSNLHSFILSVFLVFVVSGGQVQADSVSIFTMEGGGLKWSTVTINGVTLSVGEEGSVEKFETRGPYYFDVDRLKIEELRGDLKVIVDDVEEVSLSMRGTKSMIEYVEFSQDGGVLYVNSSPPQVNADIVARILSGENVSDNLRGEGVQAIRNYYQGSSEVIVRVPENFALDLSDISGDIDIGDTLGSVRLTVDSYRDIAIGQIGSLDLLSNGSGNVSVNSVQNFARVTVGSYGDVSIQDGDVESLVAVTQSSGDFTYNGNSTGTTSLTAESYGEINIGGVIANAELKTENSGDILVDKVIGSIEATAESYGDIYIRDGSVDLLTAMTENSGEFYFGGTAKDVNLTSTSYGDIYVGEVTGTSQIDESSSGDITVGNQ